MKTNVLFTCVGTTDPVRGLHDGGMMHIARHYRPDKIHLFLSAEMEKNIALYENAFAFMREKWNYSPQITMTKSGIQDPSDLDLLDSQIKTDFESFAHDSPGSQILINLSSGTPQMEIILSQLALSTRWTVKGIQVKTPERKAGTAERVNSPRYKPEEELFNNQDELPGAPNRCKEPQLFPIVRERTWQEIHKLLQRRDYAAVLERKNNTLSPELLNIIRHLQARELLQDQQAREIAGQWSEEIRQSINPYPCKTEEEQPDYWRVIDYWLMMKNMLHTGRYSDFLFRLSILALELEEAELKTLFAQNGLSYDELTYARSDYEGDRVLCMEALREHAGFIYEKLCATVTDRNGNPVPPRDDRSVYLFTRLLKCMQTPKRLMKFFNLCDNLSAKRNDVAHRMYAVSKTEFEKAVGRTTGTMEKEIEAVIAMVWPQCDREIFTLHERALACIEQKR